MKARVGTVLIIDDNIGVTETFARILRLEGHNVETALTAEAGLQAADAAEPDAIILDLRMPLVNGLGFLYRLRERERERHRSRYTPVAVVTGDYGLDGEVAHEIADLGAELHFKPLWSEDLIDLARTLMASTLPLDRPGGMRAEGQSPGLPACSRTRPGTFR